MSIISCYRYCLHFVWVQNWIKHYNCLSFRELLNDHYEKQFIKCFVFDSSCRPTSLVVTLMLFLATNMLANVSGVPALNIHTLLLADVGCQSTLSVTKMITNIVGLQCQLVCRMTQLRTESGSFLVVKLLDVHTHVNHICADVLIIVHFCVLHL